MADKVADIAQQHGFSADAGRAVAEALRRGGGGMAQFSHPELGGQGQWASGGMLMIGDMFNDDLKARVGALCKDLASVAGQTPAAPEQNSGQTHDWWPDKFGKASSTGAQNEMRYACFPDEHRLAVMRNGQVTVYDTGEHRITGFSQQQGGSQSLSFTSQNGPVRLEDLNKV